MYNSCELVAYLYLGQPLVLLSDVVLLSQIHEINDGLRSEQEVLNLVIYDNYYRIDKIMAFTKEV